MRKSILPLLLFFVLITGCSAPEEEPIVIGISSWPGYGYVLLAEEKGFFKDRDVNAKFDVDISSSLANTYEKYLNREADIMLVPINYAIDANMNGMDSSVVMYLDSSDSSDVFVVPPSVKNYSDLKGKVLGVEGFNSYSHVFVLQLMERHGLLAGDYELKKVAGEDVVKELDAGTISGGYTWGPTKAEAVEKGYVILGRGSDLPRLISDVMVVPPEFAHERREEVEGIIRGILDARMYAQANPEDSFAIISRRMNVPVDDVRVIVSEVAMPSLEDNVEAMMDSDDDASLYRVGETIADFYIETGQIAAKPNITEMIDPSFINAIAQNR